MSRLTIIIVWLLAVVFTAGISGGGKNGVNTDHYNVSYQTAHGALHGLYVSSYTNGQKKAEGKFSQNHRKADWAFYDSTGTLLARRNYLSADTFKITYPALPKNDLVQLLINPVCVDLAAPVTEDALKANWWERVDRHLLPADNPVLFDNERLYKALIKAVVSGKVQAYTAGSVEPMSLGAVNTMIAANGSTVAYYVVEELHIFSLQSMSMLNKAEKLKVVVQKSETDRKGRVTVKDIELFWFKLDELKEALSLEKLFFPGQPKYINHLDELFLFNYYGGQIYDYETSAGEQVNLKDKFPETEAFNKATAQAEVALVEQENDLIIYYNGKP